MKKSFLLVALLATLIPVIFVIFEVGGWQNWQGVTPRGVTDSLYYYARIHEVTDGYPLVGNPYVYEYRETFAPAFFLPDIVSAIPILLGVPFNIAIMINFFIWSFVLLILIFHLLQLLYLPKRWAAFWSVASYISVYSLMLRPTIMQLIYPLFIAFLIALIKFLDEPRDGWRKYFLALAAASTFYAYTFLAYIVLLSLGLIFFWYLFTKRYQELKALLVVALYSALLLIPFGITTIMQIGEPNYFETLSRIGLVYTHIPSIEAFFYGRWVVVGLIALSFLWFLSRKPENKSETKVFWFSIGLSLLASAFLNVVTGVEMTLAVHIGRFIILWMPLILGALLYQWFTSSELKTHKTKYALVGLFLLILASGVVRNVPRGLSFFKFNNRGEDIASLQSLAGPLKWLQQNAKEEAVIWTNDSIAEYIPVMTRHYPLFAHGTVLHSISNQELEDRYLLSRSLGSTTIDDLKNDFGIYAGRGAAKEAPRIQHKDAIEIRGEEYFQTLLRRFNNIKENQGAQLAQFSVKYLLIDRINDDFGNLSLSKALYDDGRFVILPIPLLSL